MKNKIEFKDAEADFSKGGPGSPRAGFRTLPGRCAAFLSSHAVKSLYSFRDPLLYGFLCLGAIGFFLPQPRTQIDPVALLGKAALEELLFRWLLQETLAQTRLGGRLFGIVTRQNIIASLVFAAIHLPTRAPLAAASVFFPSLVFGTIWDRHGTLFPCALVHFTYNACLFYGPKIVLL